MADGDEALAVARVTLLETHGQPAIASAAAFDASDALDDTRSIGLGTADVPVAWLAIPW